MSPVGPVEHVLYKNVWALYQWSEEMFKICFVTMKCVDLSENGEAHFSANPRTKIKYNNR